MTKFTLSKPQRMLSGLAIALFIISILWMLFFVVRDISSQLSRGITISYASVAPTDDAGKETQTLVFDEVINQPSGESILTWNGNKLYLFGPAQIVITADTANLQSGFAYLDAGNKLTLTLNSQQLPISNIQGLYDATTSGFTVTAGKQQVNSAETAQINNVILYDGAKFTTASFQRDQLQTDKWIRVLTLLAAKAQLPVTLSDLVPPVVNNILPANNFSTAAEAVDISGVSEPGATIRIGKDTFTTDAQGKFSHNVPLATGKDNILLVVTDAAGNETDLNLQYERTSSATVVTGCTQTAFAAKLQCLINVYRRQKSLPDLTLNDSITGAAQNHSNWMKDNNKLDHTEDDGSTPASRCNSLGATCTAESIAKIADATAESVLQFWQSQPEDNSNILGTHTEMGGAVSGQYITLDLH